MKFIILFLPLFLMANPEPHTMQVEISNQSKWILQVEKALQSNNVCQELSMLIKSKDSDRDINLVLKEIIRTRCRN